MTHNNESMSESDEEQPTPQTRFDTTDVGASIDSHGVQWEGGADGRLNTNTIGGDVSFWLSQDDGDSLVSVSVYFSPEIARQIASSLRIREHVHYSTEVTSIWVERGWMYSEGPHRKDEGHTGTVKLDPFSDGYRIELEYVGEDESDTLRVQTQLSDEERDGFATALEYMADVADQYDPPKTKSPNSASSESKSSSWLTRAVPIAAAGAVSVGIASFVMSRLTTEMTINGETVSGPSPVTLAFMMLFVMSIAFAIQYLPGHIWGRRT